MAVRKENTFGINLTNKAILYLQKLGYVDGNKHIDRKMNFSRFISKLIIGHVKLYYPNDARMYNESFIQYKLDEVQDERDRLEKEILRLANELRDARALNTKQTGE